MISLPEPDFIARDPATITAEIIAQYQDIMGKTLYPGQVERVLIDVLAYRETMVRIAIQEAAKQNLLYYARAPMLDYLGDLMGVLRLPAAAAQAAMTFTLDAARGADLVIPAGTQLSAGVGQPLSRFATNEALTIAAGQTTGIVWATALTPGVSGNLYALNQINTIDDDLGAPDLSVANSSISSGGSDVEIDDHLRERIRLAPESYTTAGSYGAYRFHALSAHPSIVDVAIRSVRPGQVLIYPLCATGLPDTTILSLVQAACNAETVRPLCDQVVVAAPIASTYTITAGLVIFADVDGAGVLATAKTSLEQYVQQQSQRLGRDVALSSIQAALTVPGIARVNLAQPIANIVAATHEWLQCSSQTVTIESISDENL